MKNIKIIKTGINVSKIKKQLEKHPEDWGSQKDLKDAYDFMMNWMSDFSEKFPYEEKDKKFTPEELAKKLRVLKEEEIEVQEMRDQINASIVKAENLLKS